MYKKLHNQEKASPCIEGSLFVLIRRGDIIFTMPSLLTWLSFIKQFSTVVLAKYFFGIYIAKDATNLNH